LASGHPNIGGVPVAGPADASSPPVQQKPIQFGAAGGAQRIERSGAVNFYPALSGTLQDLTYRMLEQANLSAPMPPSPVELSRRQLEILPGASPAQAQLALIPGGFAYRGRNYDLTGRPRAMLAALVGAPHQRHTASHLCEALGLD